MESKQWVPDAGILPHFSLCLISLFDTLSGSSPSQSTILGQESAHTLSLSWLLQLVLPCRADIEMKPFAIEMLLKLHTYISTVCDDIIMHGSISSIVTTERAQSPMSKLVRAIHGYYKWYHRTSILR